MKNKQYAIQITMLTFGIFLIAGLVFVQNTFAQGGGGGSGSGGGSGDQTQDRDQIQDPATHDGDEPIQDRDQLQDRDTIQYPTVNTTTLPIQDQLRDQDRDRIQDPTTHDGDEPEQDRDQLRDQDRDRIRIDVENDAVPVGNAQQLQNTIQNREQELNQETTSTTEQYREIMQNQNRVRLAIHAIYASEGLLGTVGPQARQITERINNSVQATVNAEAEIRARGVLAHILFGGDSVNAQILQQEQEQNHMRIQELRVLISEATTTAEIRATLMEQIRVMEEEQARLAQLAEKESGEWGIFSWRF